MEVISTVFFGFLAGAILVETIGEIIGDWIPKIDPKTLSILIGLIVAFYANFNILQMVGLDYGWAGNNTMDIVGVAIGIVFSGLILSRGSNGVHDFIQKIKAAKERDQAEAQLLRDDATTLDVEYGAGGLDEYEEIE